MSIQLIGAVSIILYDYLPFWRNINRVIEGHSVRSPLPLSEKRDVLPSNGGTPFFWSTTCSLLFRAPRPGSASCFASASVSVNSAPSATSVLKTHRPPAIPQHPNHLQVIIDIRYHYAIMVSLSRHDSSVSCEPCAPATRSL
jgi:hypothetical protein